MILCIYHGNCADGFTAAWVVRRFMGEDSVEFYPGVYQRDPPDVTDRDVIFVDFCYKREVMLELAKKARSVMVLDHHKSAAIDMDALPNHIWGFSRIDWENMVKHGDERSNLMLEFDMTRSGAGLAWDFFFPDEPRPALIDHVEDRDLWKFKLPLTREIQAAVFSYPYEFPTWDKLIDSFDEFGHSPLMAEGMAIERKHFKDIRELLDVVTRPMHIGGHTVPIANLPYTMASDAGHLLCEQDPSLPFAGCYYDGKDGRNFSLRSIKGGIDVSEIAKLYGGGGHYAAAGFRVSYEKAREFEV